MGVASAMVIRENQVNPAKISPLENYPLYGSKQEIDHKYIPLCHKHMHYATHLALECGVLSLVQASARHHK